MSSSSSSSKNLLKHLLDEVQEPFVLKNYIDERRYQLKLPLEKKTQFLQIKRRKPISENSNFFSKNACFLSFHESPDIKMSPLFSPIKTPNRNSPNTPFFVHIPSRTATLLLEAALRIQKNSSSKKSKNVGFRFFGSMLKRITHRSRKRNTSEDINDGIIKVKDILRWDSYNGCSKVSEEMKTEESSLGSNEIRVSEVGFSCSCNSRLSSAWSESNEDKSFDLETSTTSTSDDSEEMEFVHQQIRNGDFSLYDDKDFCSSPFRFVLQNNLSSGEFTPELRSPVTSPSRLTKQVEKHEEGKEFVEEEKEQFSPVSVLDPHFEEDYNEEGEEDDEDEDDIEHELERSFDNVQRSRQHLLHKLRRFELLAELDPLELEKRIAEEEEGSCVNEDKEALLDGYKGDLFVKEVLSVSNLWKINERVPSHMKKLVLDLIHEEEGKESNSKFSSNDREMKMKKTLKKRLDSWKEVESNTIDMMVELDFRSEGEEWRKTQEQVRETVIDIEIDIFSFLVKEFSEDLVSSKPY